jgi:glucosamine kinase
LVIETYQSGDMTARQLMQAAAEAVTRVGHTLMASQVPSLPCSLIGGVAPFIEPLLAEDLKARLKPCQATPDEGAIMLVKRNI